MFTRLCISELPKSDNHAQYDCLEVVPLPYDKAADWQVYHWCGARAQSRLWKVPACAPAGVSHSWQDPSSLGRACSSAGLKWAAASASSLAARGPATQTCGPSSRSSALCPSANVRLVKHRGLDTVSQYCRAAVDVKHSYMDSRHDPC